MKPNNPISLDFARYSEEEMFARAHAYYQLMRRRRSVRDFSSELVPRRLIEQCLLTAGSANCQPWHFAVVQNPALKQQIRLEA